MECVVCFKDFSHCKFSETDLGLNCKVCTDKTFVCNDCVKGMTKAIQGDDDQLALCPVCRSRDFRLYFRISCLSKIHHEFRKAELLVEIFFPINGHVEYCEKFNEIKVINEEFLFFYNGTDKLVKENPDGNSFPLLVWERNGKHAGVALEKVELPTFITASGEKITSRHGKDCYYRMTVEDCDYASIFKSFKPLQAQEGVDQLLKYYFKPYMSCATLKLMLGMLQVER